MTSIMSKCHSPFESLFGEIIPPPINRELQCDFCGRYDGEPVELFDGPSYAQVYRNHFEDHLEPPRTVNICHSCHTSLHRKKGIGHNGRGKRHSC